MAIHLVVHVAGGRVGLLPGLTYLLEHHCDGYRSGVEGTYATLTRVGSSPSLGDQLSGCFRSLTSDCGSLFERGRGIRGRF